jgi:exonuclease VII small subunit
MLDAGLYQFLATQFTDAEQSAGRARSRLRFLGLFTWLPGTSGRIKESVTQLETAYFLARGGRSLATAYERALEPSLEKVERDLALQSITEALQQAQPLLKQAEGDLSQARQLLRKLGEGHLDPRYAALINSYLPQIQAVVYISRVSPQTIGRAYVLSRELITVGDLAADPLKVLSDPAGVKQSLATIVGLSHRLAEELEQLERTLATNTTEPASDQQELLPVIHLMKQGVILLKNVTEVAEGFLALAAVVEKRGFLTRNFGVEAEPVLREAEAKVFLAREQTASFRALLPRQGRDASALPPFVSPASDAKSSLGSIERLEALLGQTLDSVRFLQYLLGFQGPRTYLILGQNQQEIRATGGFIGVVLQATVDRGDLVDLVYHDSTTVDSLPPKYPNNPPAPEPIYWYLWMGKLLFRDANWSPHFPTSAARLAELYRLGRGVQVDGVITGNKQLTVDMVDLLRDIRVPGLAEPLTREMADYYTNADDTPYKCSEGHVSGRDKRCFDEDLFFALKARLTSQISDQERAAIVRTIKTALDKGNIMVHVFNPDQAKVLENLGWNGAIPQVNHDYLLVVDSSLPGHTAGSVVRHWDYQVSMQVGKPATAQLRVRYDHQGTRPKGQVCRQSEFFVCYWNYFRIYVPRTATNVVAPPVPLHEGSEKLIWGYSDADSGSLVRDADTGPARLTEVGGYIAVEPGSITTVPLEYQLPWKLVRPIGRDSFEYRLLVQKQPGMDQDRVSVAVELPPGTELLAISPTPKTRNGQWVTFEFPLDSDKQVVVTFKASGG